MVSLVWSTSTPFVLGQCCWEVCVHEASLQGWTPGISLWSMRNHCVPRHVNRYYYRRFLWRRVLLRKNALKPAPSTEIAIPRRRTLLRRIVATRAGPDDDHHAIAPHDLEQLAAPRRARRSVLHLAGRTSAVARAPRGRFHVTAHPAAREGGACVGLTKGAPSASR